MNNLLQHPAKEVLRQALKKELGTQVFFAGCLMIAGLGLVMQFFDTSLFWVGVGLILCFFGAWLFRIWGHTGFPENAQIWKYLHERPQEIVWIYTVCTEIMPFGISIFCRDYLILKTLEGKEYSLCIPTSKRRLVDFWLRRLLPQATFGYSKEKEEIFLNNPRRLIRPHDGEIRP